MSDTPNKPRFPALTLLLCVSGWTGLALVKHDKLIGTALASVGGVLWAAVVGLTSGIWSRAEKTLVEIMGEWVEVQIRDIFSCYRKRYLSHISSRYGTFDVKGLITQGPFSLEIERVYVELVVEPKQARDVSGHPLSTGTPQEIRHDLWAFISATTGTYRSFAILGPPGSGKTTLLKHLAVVIATNHGRHDRITRTPILLLIREHSETIVGRSDQKLIDIVEVAAKRMGIPPPDGWFQREFAKGRCLVMIDGLDEIADPVSRRIVVDWVDREMEAFDTKNQFLVTSRPFGYRNNPLNRVTVLQVCPFTLRQTETFIQQWYLANEAMSAQKGPEDEGVRIRAKEGSSDLLERLRATPDLAELAVNPLLLTMIANVHRYRSSLPGRRVELYAEICEVFLGKRQQARGLDMKLTPSQIKSVLQPLAFAMMSTQCRELSVTDAVKIINTPILLLSQEIDGTEFLAMVQERSGLLVEREVGTWGFAHLTFQEYLAANDVIEGRREKALVRRVADSWWHETIRLFAAQADATQIVEACIAGERPTAAQLTLAVECLDEARHVQPQARERVRTLIDARLEDADPKYAQLAAETKLTLRLRRLTRVDEGCYVDSDLVSIAEYQLFIDESKAEGEFRQPDHWPETRFTPGCAKKPVVGVRPSDAEAFCEWLSRRSGGEWIYQIPVQDGGLECKADGSYWARTPEGISLWGNAAPDPRLHPEILESKLNQDLLACLRPELSYIRSPERYTDLPVDLTLKFVRDRVMTIALALKLPRSVGDQNARTQELARIRRIALNLALDHDLCRALDLDLNLNMAFDQAYWNAIALAYHLSPALRLQLELHLNRIHTDSRALLLDIASAFGGPLRKYASSVSIELGARPDTNPVMTANVQLLAVYVALLVLEERTAGRLGAFEGVRVSKTRGVK